jgi:hypothetical protein
MEPMTEAARRHAALIRLSWYDDPSTLDQARAAIRWVKRQSKHHPDHREQVALAAAAASILADERDNGALYDIARDW